VAGHPTIDAVRAAWLQFVHVGTVDTAGVRPPIAKAWLRSRAAGCDPYQARADVLSPADTIALIRSESRLVEVATPFLAALSRAAGDARHAAMLGDASGRVLKIVGDPETMADENFPRAGALLSEEIAGANGIGTALAERSYVELVGPEHFIEGFHVFTCQGVPLLGVSQEPIGVLSMSVRREETAAKVRDILFCASEAAECELLSERLTDTLAANAPLEHMLESLRQDVVQRIAMARLQFELAARQIAAGMDASGTIRAAQQLIQKFRRQASAWRNLVGQGAGAPEPLELADIVDDFMSLMDTEARVAQVRLAWHRAERLLVLDDVQALSRRLLTAFLNAMQVTPAGQQITVATGKENREAVVTIASVLPDGNQHTERTRAPLLH
jgi:sigma-54 dependent transcriptional regulator, acetoin dehydrogenase operon transcriptional activator AcoR